MAQDWIIFESFSDESLRESSYCDHKIELKLRESGQEPLLHSEFSRTFDGLWAGKTVEEMYAILLKVREELGYGGLKKLPLEMQRRAGFERTPCTAAGVIGMVYIGERHPEMLDESVSAMEFRQFLLRLLGSSQSTMEIVEWMRGSSMEMIKFYAGNPNETGYLIYGDWLNWVKKHHEYAITHEENNNV